MHTLRLKSLRIEEGGKEGGRERKRERRDRNPIRGYIYTVSFRNNPVNFVVAKVKITNHKHESAWKWNSCTDYVMKF